MAYLTDGMIGVDLTATTAGTSTDGAGAEFTLGLTRRGTDDTLWCYVQAGAAVAQYAAAGLDENFQMVEITSTLARTGLTPAFPQVAFDDNDFGWVALNAGGSISVKLAASCAADVQLYTTATAGVLDDTATSTASLVRGVVTIAASTSQASTREIIAANPSYTASA